MISVLGTLGPARSQDVFRRVARDPHWGGARTESLRRLAQAGEDDRVHSRDLLGAMVAGGERDRAALVSLLELGGAGALAPIVELLSSETPGHRSSILLELSRVEDAAVLAPLEAALASVPPQAGVGERQTRRELLERLR